MNELLQLHGLIGGGAIGTFFGDGRDGVLNTADNPAAIPATTPSALNGGTAANLTDGNAGTTFTTNVVNGAGGLFRIVFASKINLKQVVLKGARVSTGTAQCLLFLSETDSGSEYLVSAYPANLTTTPTDITIRVPADFDVKSVYLQKSDGNCSVSINEVQFTASTVIKLHAEIHEGLVQKQYESVTINDGHVLTTDNPCRGLVLYSKGDVTVNGKISMSKKAGLAPNGQPIPVFIGKEYTETKWVADGSDDRLYDYTIPRSINLSPLYTIDKGTTGKTTVKDSKGNIYSAALFKTASDNKYQIIVKKWDRLTEIWSDLPAVPQNTEYDQMRPTLAIDADDNLHLAWVGVTRVSGPPVVKYAKFSEDEWSGYVDLTNGDYNQYSPDIALDSNGLPCIVWYGHDASNTANTQIKFSRFNGTSWTPWINVYRDPLQNGNTQRNATIFVKDKVYIAYEQYTNEAKYQIVINRFNLDLTNLITYRCRENLLDPVGGGFHNYDQYDPDIFIDSDNMLHLVWSARSPNIGTISQVVYVKIPITLTGYFNVTLVSTTNGYNQNRPKILIDRDGFPHVVWSGRDSVNTTYDQVKYSKFDGSAWTAWQNLSNESLHYAVAPSFCYNLLIFEKPIIVFEIYNTNNSYSLKITGKWSEGGHYETVTNKLKLYNLSSVFESLKGGKGGNGGAGGKGDGTAIGPSQGGRGGKGRHNLGGFGGGGGGGIRGDNANYWSHPACDGGSVDWAELGGGGDTYRALSTSAAGLNTKPAKNGAGGGSVDGGRGGTCLGGGGGGASDGANGIGGNGEFAGGFILIIAGGNITIGATGVIEANGGVGGKGADCSNATAYGGGAGGGGAGGGVIGLLYAGTYTNSGVVQANGGVGGAAGTSKNAAGSGTSGSAGTIKVQKIS